MLASVPSGQCHPTGQGHDVLDAHLSQGCLRPDGHLLHRLLRVGLPSTSGTYLHSISNGCSC